MQPQPKLPQKCKPKIIGLGTKRGRTHILYQCPECGAQTSLAVLPYINAAVCPGTREQPE